MGGPSGRNRFHHLGAESIHGAAPKPKRCELLFQLDPKPLEECLTAYAGIPLFVQVVRSLDVLGRVQEHLQIRQRQWELDEAG